MARPVWFENTDGSGNVTRLHVNGYVSYSSSIYKYLAVSNQNFPIEYNERHRKDPLLCMGCTFSINEKERGIKSGESHAMETNLDKNDVPHVSPRSVG